MDRHALFANLKTAVKKKKKHVLMGVAVVALASGGFFGARMAMKGKGGHDLAENHDAHDRAPASEHGSTEDKHVATAPAGHGDAHGEAPSAHTDAATADHAAAPAAAKKPSAWTPGGLMKTYEDAFDSIQAKVDTLRRAEEENRRLRLENTHLKLRAEGLQFDCQARDAAARTKELEMKLSGETGAKVGRTLASIYYRPPTHLLPPQLYTLAVSYFNAREDEKAAVIMTFLTGLEENDAYKTPKNLLMTGVAWYRLDNFDVADQYFGRVLEAKESADTIQYQAQARLWRGLVAERSNHHEKAQTWLRELLDYHPHSTEAGWVNSKEAKRVPATGTLNSDDE